MSRMRIGIGSVRPKRFQKGPSLTTKKAMCNHDYC